MFKKLFLLLGLNFAANMAHAETYLYTHNGSQVVVDVNGKRVNVTYDQPRAGLVSIGVRAGTVLFQGKVKDGYLDGMAFMFSRACGAMDYFVYGDFTPGQDFTLHGAAPVLARKGCRVVDNRSDIENATLVFTASASAQRIPVAPKPGCLIGVKTSLNVRVGPGTDYARIGEYSAGRCGITIHANSCQGGWCYTRRAGVEGWVAERYLAR